MRTANPVTIQCAVVSMSRPGAVVFVPTTPPADKWFLTWSQRFEELKFERDPVLFTTETGAGRARRRTTVTASAFAERLAGRDISGMRLARATVTLLDILPPHLEFALTEPGGPVAKAVVFHATDDRADETRLLSELGFAGRRALPKLSAKNVEIPDSDLAKQTIDVTPGTVAAFLANEQAKFDAAVHEMLANEGHDDPESAGMEVRLTVGFEHLREMRVRSVVLVAGGREIPIAAGTTTAVADVARRVLRNEPLENPAAASGSRHGGGGGGGARRKRRKIDVMDARLSAAFVARALMGGHRVRMHGGRSLAIACDVARTLLEYDREDPAASALPAADAPPMDRAAAFARSDALRAKIAAALQDDAATSPVCTDHAAAAAWTDVAAALDLTRAEMLRALEHDDAGALAEIREREERAALVDAVFLAGMRDVFFAHIDKYC